MNYDRNQPSPRQRAMLELYTRLHAEGEKFDGLAPDETYPGVNLLQHVFRIKTLIDRTGARTLLDYGAGKGLSYDLSPVKIPGLGMIDSILDYWDIDVVHCYDPCHAPFSRVPQETFDAVISTDVLEHCPEEDLPWIVGELFRYSRKFVFASIACYPARTRLPNGENAHCTIRPAEWWCALFAATAAAHAGRSWRICVQFVVMQGGERRMVDEEFSSDDVAS
jgi:hypothetical protein